MSTHDLQRAAQAVSYPVHRGDSVTQEADPNPFPAGGVRPLHTTIGAPHPAGAWFDADEADAAVAFIALMRHTQGPLAGQPFILSPEQAWVTREAFGWMHVNEAGQTVRQYRTVYVEEGRGNGKSQWGAGVAGKLLFADGEGSPEVVGAAKDRKQAGIILRRLKAMVATNPDLRKRSIPRVNKLEHRTNGGVYEATSADVGGAWGGAPHGIIFDEIHAQPNRDLWDALTTGMGKRLQPMIWAFTTAGWDRESLCWELHEFTREIEAGSVTDTAFLGVVWAASEDADWTMPETWQQANPMLAAPGSTLTPSGAAAAITHAYMAAECEKAKAMPAFQNTFRTMYLSQWVGQEVRFMPMDAWDACGDPIETGKRAAFGGLDLSSTTDLSAYVIVSEREGKLDIDLKVYAPAEGLRERSRRDRAPYEVWAREGYLTLTPGATIDQNVIKADVLASHGVYDLRDAGYDRWNAAKVVMELEAEGVTMVPIGQGFASLSNPTKELLRLVVDGNVRHGGNPILRWMMTHTAAVTDSAENIKPDKARSGGRIDGVAALVSAIDGWMRRGRDLNRVSVYDSECDLCGYREGHAPGCRGADTEETNT